MGGAGHDHGRMEGRTNRVHLRQETFGEGTVGGGNVCPVSDVSSCFGVRTFGNKVKKV